MTIQQLQKKYSNIESDLLLSHVLGKPKEFLYLNSGTELSDTQYQRLLKMIRRRRRGEPIAYILGYKHFYGLKFKVNKHVLIPRPETEWLVDRALVFIFRAEALRSREAKVTDSRLGPAKRGPRSSNKDIQILDLGTGSGCIAISIAHSLSAIRYPLSANITASDISTAALKVAKANAKTHHANIKFVQSDLFKNIQGKFDLVIANLPYVPRGMYELLYPNLKYEPKIAITDGSEIWRIYSRFFTQLPKHLKPNGAALLEIDDGAKPDLQKMLKTIPPNFKTRFFKDLGGHWRYLQIWC